MRNIGLFAVIPLLIFPSCSNSLDVLDPIDPIPIVYCQINPTDKIFYLTLTRTFSGDGSAYDLARDANQIFYDSADIRLEGWENQYKVWENQFEPSDRSKYPGIFPETPGYCFELSNNGLIINTITTVRLVINLPGISSPVFSRISLMPVPPVPSRYDHEIALYPNGYEFDCPNGPYLQLLCAFNYQEYEGLWVDHSVTFTLRKEFIIPGGNTLYADMFFNRLVQNIAPINDTILRKFISLDLICLVGDKNFKDYMNTYENSSNQDLPLKGNINNGYGLFAMVTSVKYVNMFFDRHSFDSLCKGEIAGKLGFVRW